MKRRREKLPKWRYEFDCRKCDNIREVHDPRKGRDGDYCIPCIEHIWRRCEMKNIKTTTRRLFVTTQIAALGWVTMSYLIALYATVRLGQVFPVVDLSKQAIETILGVNVLKVVENIFEHNDGAVFGKSNAPEKKIKRDC